MTFEDCLRATLQTPEMFEQFCRLYGYGLPRSRMAAMVDKATGIEQDRIREYVRFIYKTVWLPLARVGSVDYDGALA